MKNLLTMLFVFLILGLRCNDNLGDDNPKKEISEKDLIGSWELIRIEEQDENSNWTQIKSPETPVGQVCLVNLEFKNDGWFYGDTCSNKFFGNYEINQSDGIIDTNNVIYTKAGDTTSGYKYRNYFANSELESYSILSDTLILSGRKTGDNKFKMIYKPANK